jgi:sterol 14-demethylase
MDFASRANVTLAELDAFQSPRTVGVAALVTALLSLLAFVSYSPRIHPKAPKFTSDTVPILGSLGYGTRQW